MFSALALIALLIGSISLFTPGDTSGIPYPTGQEEMKKEIVKLEEWLEAFEPEYQKCLAYTRMKMSNALFSKDTRMTLNFYGDWAIKRRNAKQRLTNLKKLLEKYEEIDAVLSASRPDHVLGEG